jgi:hypothetical protein
MSRPAEEMELPDQCENIQAVFTICRADIFSLAPGLQPGVWDAAKRIAVLTAFCLF